MPSLPSSRRRTSGSAPRALPAFLPILLLLSACGSDEASPPQTAETPPAEVEATHAFDDPRLDSLYDEMMAEMAPDGGRERLRYLQFAFVVDRGEGNVTRRHHRWDVWGGRYRVDAPVEAGRMVALFDVDDPTGTDEIWLDGEPVADAARSDSLAQRAHAMFINDSYWLLMPYKWDDPGVTATYLGEQELEGESYEVVELTFDAVGLTPQNKYRGFVDPETDRMAYWQHFTDADDPEPRFTMAWTDWQRMGPILLSPTRVDLDGNLALSFEELEASTTVPDDVFTAPADRATTGSGGDS